MSLDLTASTQVQSETPSKHGAGRPVRQLVIIGGGGHGREVADIVRSAGTHGEILGIVDDGTPDRLRMARAGLRFLGSMNNVIDRDLDYLIGIGMPAVRRAVAEKLQTDAASALLHPDTSIGTDTIFDSGCVIAQRCVVTTNVRLGTHTHLNVGATLSHDVTVGSFVTISPGCHIAGEVEIEDDVFIGIGASILPRVRIGRGAVVGAGAVVTKHVAPGVTVAGVPASQIA